MTNYDVLQLFRDKAKTLGEVQPTQNDIIERLAQLLALSRESLPAETFDELVHIGAVIYQEGLGHFRARSELAETMRQSTQGKEP